MYIESVPNRNSPPAILLRESYRHQGKVRKRTLCNLSGWSSALRKDKPEIDWNDGLHFCTRFLRQKSQAPSAV